MRKFLHRFFDIREGEGLNASLMFAGIFLIIASLLIVKPVGNSLFLTRFGVEKLPYVFILVAFFAAIAASIYAKFAGKVRPDYLILNSFIISIIGLFIFWVLLHFQYKGDWLIYAFYIWVALFGIIISTQFWLLANNIFNARQAKRLFGFIGVGAISGGIFGGYLTSLLAPRLRTENLIFFCIGFLFICIFLLLLVWKRRPRYGFRESDIKRKLIGQAEITDNPIKLILNSRHLIYLAGLMGIGVVVANLVDYQFSAVASMVITDQDRLTAFFGFWMSNLNIISLVIQLFLTGRIMKHFGVGTSLLFLPMGILVGAAAVLVNPTLVTAVLIKISDGGFKHSINKTGIEILALPIPQKIKSKTKAFIDIFVNNLAIGIAGIFLIILTTVLGFSISHISLIIIGLIAIWIYLVIRARSEYVNSFRQAIEKRTIDIEQQSLNLEDALVFKSILNVLNSGNQRQILYILNLMEDVKNKELIPYLKKLISHPSNEIKSAVLKMIQQYDELDLTSETINLASNTDQTVQIEAIRYLCKRSDDNIATLKSYLNHDDFRTRCAAMICAAEEWKENKQFRQAVDIKKLIDDMLKSSQLIDGDEDQEQYLKTVMARVVGIAGAPELYPYLHKMLGDKYLEVIQSAVASAGMTRADEFIPILISFLKTKKVRKLAREALTEYGEEIIDILTEHLENSNEDKNIRLGIPKVLTLTGSQKSANMLLRNLHQSNLLLRYEILKALNKLKVKSSLLKFDKQILRSCINSEIKNYYRTSSLLYQQKNSLGDELASTSENHNSASIIKARQLLIHALKEKLEINLERIFRLLGLIYMPKDMYYTYLGIVSQKSDLKANAIEFLDNILETNLKKVIIPIVERDPSDIAIGKIQQLLGLDLPSKSESLKILLSGEDNWLKVCALHLVGEFKYDEYGGIITELANDSDPMVRQTAQYCLERKAM